MRQIIVPAIFLTTILLGACNKESKKATDQKDGARPADTATSACILNKLSALQNQPKQNPPAVVYEYVYNGRRVYYITADCCDQYNFLYDSACNVLCAPDGGFTGHGDGDCTDFYQTATGQRLVWKDPR